MTKREAIAWLEKHHACATAMRRVRKCASVRQMIAKAPHDDLSWVLLHTSDRIWRAYAKQNQAAWAQCIGRGYEYGWYDRERAAIARRILLAWAASQ